MKQEKLYLYRLNMKYVRDLHKADDKVQSISPQIHKSNRPFVGVLVVLDEKQYCVPLDHPKKKHSDMNNDIDFSKIVVDGKLLAVLNFNNMIPVNDSLIKRIDLKISPYDSSAEKAYKILCAKELDWIQKHQNAIIKKANKLYKMISLGKADNRLQKRCVDFVKLESVLHKWELK